MKILYHKKSKKFWFVKSLDRPFSTHLGTIASEALKSSGGKVFSNKGETFYIFNPKFSDVFKQLKRLPQGMLAKDIGIIIAETGIGKDSIVVDGGTGSGLLACALANVCKAVYTYEIREDFIRIAKNNIKFLGLKNIEIKKANICEKIEERNVDLVALDLPEPWRALNAAIEALALGGWIVAYSPQITQSLEFVNKALEKENLAHIKTLELIQREWRLEKKICRPYKMPTVHSGFLTFLRKVF